MLDLNCSSLSTRNVSNASSNNRKVAFKYVVWYQLRVLFPLCSNFAAHAHSYCHLCISLIAWCKIYFTVETWFPWIFSQIFIYSYGYKPFWIKKISFSSQPGYLLLWIKFSFSTNYWRCFVFFVWIFYTIAMDVLAIKNYSLYIVISLIALNPTEIVT